MISHETTLMNLSLSKCHFSLSDRNLIPDHLFDVRKMVWQGLTHVRTGIFGFIDNVCEIVPKAITIYSVQQLCYYIGVYSPTENQSFLLQAY